MVAKRKKKVVKRKKAVVKRKKAIVKRKVVRKKKAAPKKKKVVARKRKNATPLKPSRKKPVVSTTGQTLFLLGLGAVVGASMIAILFELGIIGA